MFVFSDANSAKERKALLKQVETRGGVLIVSYETLRCENDIIASKKYFYVVLDEGQKIKNHKS